VKFAPLTLWSCDAYRCVLRRVDGRLEVLLQEDGRVTRMETCESEHDARAKAQEWVIELEGIPHH
jgi:hypothetical protein